MQTDFDPFAELFKQIVEDIRLIKKDIAELNKFKWKLAGALSILSFLGGAVAQFLVIWMKEK